MGKSPARSRADAYLLMYALWDPLSVKQGGVMGKYPGCLKRRLKREGEKQSQARPEQPLELTPHVYLDLIKRAQVKGSGDVLLYFGSISRWARRCS